MASGLILCVRRNHEAVMVMINIFFSLHIMVVALGGIFSVNILPLTCAITCSHANPCNKIYIRAEIGLKVLIQKRREVDNLFK